MQSGVLVNDALSFVVHELLDALRADFGDLVETESVGLMRGTRNTIYADSIDPVCAPSSIAKALAPTADDD